MTRKIQIWTATQEFELDGEQYQKGDEWAQPAGWTFDEDFYNFHKGGKVAFLFEIPAGSEIVQTNEGKKSVKSTSTSRVILPVKRKDA